MTARHPDSARGWFVVAAAAMSMFAVFGVAYSFGASFTSMAEEFDSGTGATALVFSLTVGFSFALGLVTGRWVDRVGPRRVLLAGAVSLVAGLLLTTQVNSLFLGYLTYGVGVGFAIACGYVPMVSTVGGWFVKQRSMALGFAVAGIGLGTLVGSPLAARLIVATSWRTTFVIFATGGGTLMVIAALVSERGPVAVAAPKPRPLGELLRVRPFAILYVSMVFISYGVFIPFVFLVRSAEVRGIAEVPAAWLVGLVGGFSVVGRLGLGAMADRFGAVRLYLGSFSVIAGSQLIWLVAGSNYPLLVTYAMIYGIGYGGFIALSPAVVADVFGLEGLGGMIGTLYTGAAIGSFTGPPVAGWVIDQTDDQAAPILALILSVIGTLILARLKAHLATGVAGSFHARSPDHLPHR